MCNTACLEFGERTLNRDHVAGRSILEVGSRNINGSLRTFIASLGPSEFLGVDIVEGPGVDELCDAAELVTRYGECRWDLVVSTEMLEHVWDWQRVISNLKLAVAAMGHLLITTRSFGFPYHEAPYDYWRFELVDMRAIFSDFNIIELEPDPSIDAGVFMYARKPESFTEINLDNYPLYSMLTNEKLITNTMPRPT